MYSMQASSLFFCLPVSVHIETWSHLALAGLFYPLAFNLQVLVWIKVSVQREPG